MKNTSLKLLKPCSQTLKAKCENEGLKLFWKKPINFFFKMSRRDAEQPYPAKNIDNMKIFKTV